MLVLSSYQLNILWVSLTLCFSYCGRFVQYKATSLEKQHKHELLTEPDLGVTIDLINPDTYRIDPTSELENSSFHFKIFIFVKKNKIMKFYDVVHWVFN